MFLQHPGSDSAVWQDAPPAGRYAALRDAANRENFKLRVDDVPAVLGAAGIVAGCDDTAKRTVQHLNRGLDALNQSSYSFARQELRKAHELAPNDADTNFYLGFLELRDGKASRPPGPRPAHP